MPTRFPSSGNVRGLPTALRGGISSWVRQLQLLWLSE